VLEVLFGDLVRGSIDNFEAGKALVTDAVRRIRACPAVMCASVFTLMLLVNIGAHVGFAAN
jgi:hypothetical protein